MQAGPDQDLWRELGGAFGLPGACRSAERLGRGHIHDTWVALYDAGGVPRRFVHQRINTRVFRDPERLMQNLERVTRHLGRKLSGLPDAERRHLRLVPARDGRPFWVGPDGGHWRTTVFVEGSRSPERIASPAEAIEAGRAFGAFARQLADLGDPPLAETIPRFHDLGSRFAALEGAARRDPCGRAGGVGAELEACRARHGAVASALEAVGPLPRRVMHNDCKVDNLLLDRASGEALCVVDLDTVMEATLLCDFGELVRSGACRAAEDEPDPARVDFDLDLVGALARGYRAGAGDQFRDAELAALPLAGAALALENALRFLADHLEGDVYFRIARPGHNLDRARAQLRLAERLWDRRDAIRRVVMTPP